MINGYQYRPHSSIPETLAAFLEGQGRPIERTSTLEIFFCGEGSGRHFEAYLAGRCKTSLDAMRRFHIECDDDYGYDGYLALLDEDNWYVCYASMFYRFRSATQEPK